jgi:hypothetical protein
MNIQNFRLRGGVAGRGDPAPTIVVYPSKSILCSSAGILPASPDLIIEGLALCNIRKPSIGRPFQVSWAL